MMHRSILLFLLCAVLTRPQPQDHTLSPGQLYRLEVNAWPDKEIPLRIEQGGRLLLDKKLSPLDPTAALYFRATSATPPQSNLPFVLSPAGSTDATEVSAAADAPIDLTLDRTYSALNPAQNYFDAPPEQGQHWFRIQNTQAQPRIVYLSVAVDDRDLPSDLQTFTRDASGALSLYREGAHAYRPEATQTMPGYSSFQTRLLAPGQQLLLRIASNHPAYSLRLRSYPAIGARTPRQAVEMGMDFLTSLGSSWHANVPRRGAPVNRQTLTHPEIQGCVACHPTIFSLRAYDTALAHGYPDNNAAATHTLARQLQNNPRPFPGLPGVTWARTIFSVRAISARMANFVPATAAFLLHTSEAKAAEEEADGAAPNVSPFEIAFEAWRATKHPRFAQQIQRQPARNVVDLAWKLTAYGEWGLPSAALQEELLSWQRPDGLFPYHFDRKEAGAEFLSWQALYALAKSGAKLDDPRIARLAQLCLSRQQISGAWQGTPTHKAFHTPFRDTQFAVMALSTLYPLGPSRMETRVGPGLVLAQNSPAQIRKSLRGIYQAARRAAEIEIAQPGQILNFLSASAQSEHALLRLEAARSAARLYPYLLDAATAPRLFALISSRTAQEQDTRVRMAWQQALYATLDENEGYLETWIQALDSVDEQASARAAIERRKQDAQKWLAQALSQASRDGKLHLLQALWDHPQRHAGLPSDWEKRTEIVLPAYFTEYQQGIRQLDASYEPYRQNAGFRYNAANPFFKTRVGNDSELPDLGSPEASLEKELLLALGSQDSELNQSALKALSIFSQGVTPAITLAVLPHFNGPLAGTVRYIFEGDARGTLRLDPPFAEENAFAQALMKVLDAQHRDALETLLPAIAKLTPGDGITRHPFLQGRIEKLLLHPEGVPLEKALAAAGVFPHIADGPLMRTSMLEAFASNDRRLQSAAVEIFIKSYIAEPTNPVLGKQFAEKSQGNVRRMMIDGLDPSRFTLRLSALNRYNPGRDVVLPEDANLFSSDVARYLVQLGSEDQDPLIQRAASELILRYPELAALRKQAIAAKPEVPSYESFVRDVQPILAQPGPDGRACVVCHATQGKFPLVMASKQGFTATQSRANYESILKEINLADPKSSLLLLKPTRPNDNAGDPALHTSTHGGGMRWGKSTLEGTASEEYERILRWIRGAR
jgi:hypothetical protein